MSTHLSTTEPVPATARSSNPISFAIGAFAAAVLFASFLSFPPLLALLFILVGVAVLVGERLYAGHISRNVALVSVVLISFGLGAVRYAVKDFHTEMLPSREGVVVSEPEDKGSTRRFIYKAENGEKALVSTALYAPVSYGDAVKVSAAFKKPGIIEGENGERDFDYGAYLAKDNIFYTANFANVEVLSRGHGNPFMAYLLMLKGSVIAHAKRILAEPYASLLLGLIVAGRDALPLGILEEFRRAGVIHIVVLSGYNITLIAEFLRRLMQKLFLFLKLPAVPQTAAAASLAGIVLFVLMTGAEATVVRAAIMAGVVIAAKFFGRTYSAPRALFFAGFLMLIENPQILVFDPSFQLSFLATLGLIYVAPRIEGLLSFVTERFQLREILAQTIATQVTVLPLLVYSMGDMSLVSLPANMLILLIVPLTMLIGFIAILLSYIGTWLALPCAYVAYLLLGWILSVAHFLGALPFATIKVPHVEVWHLVIMYGLLGTALTWSRARNYFQSRSN